MPPEDLEQDEKLDRSEMIDPTEQDEPEERSSLEDLCTFTGLHVFYVVFRDADALIIPCVTRELAEEAFFLYVKQHWDERFPDEPIPSDHKEAISQYVEDCEEYEIGITETELVVG